MLDHLKETDKFVNGSNSIKYKDKFYLYIDGYELVSAYTHNMRIKKLRLDISMPHSENKWLRIKNYVTIGHILEVYGLSERALIRMTNDLAPEQIRIKCTESKSIILPKLKLCKKNKSTNLRNICSLVE